MHFAGLESIGLMDDLLQPFDIGQLNSEQNLPGVNMSLNPIFSFLANEADDTFEVESLPNRFKLALDSVYDDYEAYIQVIKLVDSAILNGVVGAMDQDTFSLKSSLEEKVNQVIRLESRIKRITEDSLETKEKFNKQLGEKDTCILNLEQQMSKLCQDMVQLALNLNEESKKSVFLEKKVKDIQIADTLKSKQISAMREEIGKLKEERDFSLERATRESRIREPRLEEKMEHLVLDNEGQIRSLRRENAQHKTTIEALVASESNLREQIRKISEDHLNSLELVEKLEKEKQCLLKETVSLARSKDNELDTEINEIVQDQLDALEKDTEVLNDMLEDEVNDMGRQISTLRHEVRVLENTIEEQKWMDELELSIIMDVYHGLLADVASISEVSGKLDGNQYIISDLADSNGVLEEVMTEEEEAANSIFEQNAQDSGGCCENVVDEKRRLEIESGILMACLEGYSSDAGAAMEKLKTGLIEVKNKLASTQEELEISKFLEQEAHQEINNLKNHLNASSETRSRLMGALHGNNQEDNVQEMVTETVEQHPQSTEDLFKEEMQKFDIKEEMHKFDIDADVEDAIVAQDIETSIYLAYMEGLSADLACSISDQKHLSALKDTKLGFVLSEVKSLRGILEAWGRLGTTHHISEYKPQPHDNVVDGFELADLLVDEVSELYKCITSWDPSEGNLLTSNLRESLLERCWQHQIEMEILVEIFLSKFKEVASANLQVYNTRLLQFKSPSKHMSSEVDDVLSTDSNGLDNVAGDNFANEGVMDDELLPEEETESLILQLRTEISELRRERDQIISAKTEEVYKMKREFYKELDRLRHEGNEQAIRLVEKIHERSSEKGVVASHVACYSNGPSLQSNTQSGTQTRQDHGCYDNVDSELEGKNGRLVAYFGEVLKRKEHDMTLVLEEKEDIRKHKLKLEAAVQDLRNDIKTLTEKKEELLFQLEEERCHRSSMEAEVEKLICDNYNLKQELDYVQKQLQEERESKFEMEVDLQELVSQVDHLKGKLAIEEGIKSRLESDVQKLQEKIVNLNAAVSSSNVKLEESTQCIFKMELNLKRCRDETSTLVEALVATQKNLESEQNKRIMKDNLEHGLCEAQKVVECGLAAHIQQFELFAKTMDATITGMSRRVQDVGTCVAGMRGHVKHALLKQAEYKKNLRKNIRNLQKAEVEVDLLGDEVDYLLGLLEKVFAALNHYAPILKHYPGLLELSRLIKQELILRIDCGN